MNDYAHLLAINLRRAELQRGQHLQLLLDESRAEKDRPMPRGDARAKRTAPGLPALRRFLQGRGA